MKEYIVLGVALAFGLWAWLAKRKLSKASATKLDRCLEDLRKGLKAKKKEVQSAKEKYNKASKELRRARAARKPSKPSDS